MIWPPPALSVNGLFTEADGIMAWVGAGAQSDAEPHSTQLLIELVMRRRCTSRTLS